MTATPPTPPPADLTDHMTVAELLDVLGPNWGTMTDAERRAYGPQEGA